MGQTPGNLTLVHNCIASTKSNLTNTLCSLNCFVPSIQSLYEATKCFSKAIIGKTATAYLDNYFRY